jgi:DNA-binding CsgD family transcriptional regulator
MIALVLLAALMLGPISYLAKFSPSGSHSSGFTTAPALVAAKSDEAGCAMTEGWPLHQRAGLCEAARRLRKVVVLSPREREVLSLAAYGDPDQEIAGHMFVSRRTVRHYFTVLFQKLDVRNRVDVATTGLLAHVANCEECLRSVEAFRALTPAVEPGTPGALP